MSKRSGNPINFDNQILFKVLQGGSFTVPKTVASPSPTGTLAGLASDTVFQATRATVGGQLFAAVTDEAGTGLTEFVWRIKPGDVIAVSAVSSNKATITVNGETVHSLASITTNAIVLGFYG